MPNPLKTLQGLFAGPPLLVGDVTSVSGIDVTITLPAGGVLVARGIAEVGQRVFVRGGLVEGPAPVLTVVSIEV